MSDALSQKMADGVASGVFPGGQLLVMVDGEVAAEHCAGRLRNGGPEVAPDTFFDLASLTKPLSGATLAMGLVADGLLEIDAPVCRYLPWFAGGGREAVTLRHLLDHSSGLPAWRPFYKTLVSMPVAERGEGLRGLLQGSPLEAAAGAGVCYSDIGFMVLKEVVEAVAGADVRRLFDAKVRAPLGLNDLMYAPDVPVHRAVAATESCPWRGKTLCGEVHDDNAWALGGVALHAGLFGTAREVGRLVWHLVAHHRDGVAGSPFSRKVVSAFFAESRCRGRGLGFDLPSGKGSASGRYFTAGSVGHLGFTGTSFWADPRQGVVVVLLTNRVHPSRENTAIRVFRPEVHDIAMEMVREGTLGTGGRRCSGPAF
ncbi:serine hydrolase domain-containing protein [Desulfoluna spongiiphila]|uniref:serine hydrolase domain-containing protein n=1 Tax=Desulfoluna spongiiphila TaxID=419481 RepID=UPI0012534E4A|nr:serine hydrolase domain-containing protein [Desulfoluna spongiiphila]VVS93365.1 beta-lactamase-related [Desulfoluna spongiiphila]